MVALFLALPILDFGTISAGNQLHRLESGNVTPDKFDFAALRWDFGDAGRRALARLTKSPNARVAELAQTALDQKQRVYLGEGPGVRTDSDFALRVQPDDPALRQMVLTYLKTNSYLCQNSCVAVDLGPLPNGHRKVALVQGSGFTEVDLSASGGNELVNAPDVPELKPGSTVEVREVRRRYIFVDGKPLGLPLGIDASPLDGARPPR